MPLPAPCPAGYVNPDGTAQVGAYNIDSLTVTGGDRISDPGAVWAYRMGVVRPSGGGTTICFSRRLKDARARASPDLEPAVQSAVSTGELCGVPRSP